MASLKLFKNFPTFFIKKVYYSLVPFENRYGRAYTERLDLIKDSTTWTKDDVLSYQQSQLTKLLVVAYENTSYYRELFNKIRFDPYNARIADLNLIPTLSKEAIRQNANKLINRSFQGKIYSVRTSGTSGKSLTLKVSDDVFKKECAHVVNSFRSHNCDLYNEKTIWLRRYARKNGDPLFFEDYELNRIYLSAFDLNDKTVHEYVDFINKQGVRCLVSYPSTIHYLTTLCKKHNLSLRHIKSFHGASETCLEKWRDYVYCTSQIPLYMHYGQAERVSFAFQKRIDHWYTEDKLYGINELSGNNTLIATGFNNHLMPLIRYQTNDILIFDDSQRGLPAYPVSIKEIQGRSNDMLKTTNGGYVSAVNFYTMFSKFDHIQQFYVIQNKSNDSVSVTLQIENKNPPEFEQVLTNEIKQRLGDIPITISYTKNQPRDLLTGKVKLISRR